MEIFVGNLSFDETEDSIKQIFAPYGEVGRVKLLTDFDTGRSRGTAFVSMDDLKSAQSAISELDGKDHGGRELRVNQARERSERGGGSGGGDRGSRGGYNSGGSRGGNRGGNRW